MRIVTHPSNTNEISLKPSIDEEFFFIQCYLFTPPKSSQQYQSHNNISNLNHSSNQDQSMSLSQEDYASWPFIASIIYTAAWSISFYGQLYQNYKLKSVQGFSLDYLAFNISGYLLYGMYTSIGYFTNIPGAGTVVIADLVFVYHGLLMVAIQFIQVCIYQKGKNKLSIYTVAISIFIWVAVITEIICSQFFTLIPKSQYWNPVSQLGYGKLLISFIKYTPPVYWNYKRKSTQGWSIFNIILDLVGGVFSLASGSVSVQNGYNITKLVLACLTIFYDTIFIIQHYFIYPKKRSQNQIQNHPARQTLLTESTIVDNEQTQ